ncbi:MAG TPA: FAD-dependent oxidoreductase [Thermoanaerobaculia bacterium]|jgi:monoamine oxidase|nr:FAD-dependent oxidoreductase [Thermoanaerobaculia bacterium]
MERGKWTRRDFLQMVGLAGGSAAVYESMVVLGMLRTPEAYAGPPKLPAGVGAGKSVIILGAGVGGLTAALELQRAGYAVQILEAQARTGGRSLTVRTNDVIPQIGFPDQVCHFAPDQYLNAGPGRIPYHHQAVLSYCRELGVALEIYVMETRANLFQTSVPKAFDGEPKKNRQVANDTRGYISELLAKAVLKKALDDELSIDEQRNLMSLLVSFGQVNPAAGFRYEGSSRSGFRVEPGVDDPGTIEPPLKLQNLLNSGFWRHRFYQPEDYEWQPTLFQPVGGMDHFAKALAKQVESRIVLGAEVVRIINGDNEVRVTYMAGGKQVETQASFCLSNIPLPLLHRIIAREGSFKQDYRDAVGAVPFANTCKVGWQANERFWEAPDKENQIYGGISWIDHPITQMWYPSSGFFSEKKGVLTGAYNFDTIAEDFGKLSLEARLKKALEGAQRLHPRFADFVPVELGLSIAWQLVPHQRGGWADWTWEGGQQQAYDRLLEPDKQFQVVGDQVSYLPGWQEGAVLSAHHVVEQIAGIRRKAPQLQAIGRRARRRASQITGAKAEE